MPHIQRAQISLGHKLVELREDAQCVAALRRTNSMSLFRRYTPYSNRYVSTPLVNNGNLHPREISVKMNRPYYIHTHDLGPTIAEMLSLMRLLLPMFVTG